MVGGGGAGATRWPRPEAATPRSSTRRSRPVARRSRRRSRLRRRGVPLGGSGDEGAGARLRQCALRLRAQRSDGTIVTPIEAVERPGTGAAWPAFASWCASGKSRASSSGCRFRSMAVTATRRARRASSQVACRRARRAGAGRASRRALHDAHRPALRPARAPSSSEDSRAAAHLLESWLAAREAPAATARTAGARVRVHVLARGDRSSSERTREDRERARAERERRRAERAGLPVPPEPPALESDPGAAAAPEESGVEGGQFAPRGGSGAESESVEPPAAETSRIGAPAGRACPRRPGRSSRPSRSPRGARSRGRCAGRACPRRRTPVEDDPEQIAIAPPEPADRPSCPPSRRGPRSSRSNPARLRSIRRRQWSRRRSIRSRGIGRGLCREGPPAGSSIRTPCRTRRRIPASRRGAGARPIDIAEPRTDDARPHGTGAAPHATEPELAADAESPARKSPAVARPARRPPQPEAARPATGRTRTEHETAPGYPIPGIPEPPAPSHARGSRSRRGGWERRRRHRCAAPFAAAATARQRLELQGS